MKVLIISKNMEYFRNAYRLLNISEDEVMYGREVQEINIYAKKYYLDGVVIDLPYPNIEELRACLKLKAQSSKTKIMILTLEISRHARSEMVKKGCDVFIAEPAPIYIEKLASFSETLGVSYKNKIEKIDIDSGVLFDVGGWKIVRNGEKIPLPEKEFKLFYLFATNKDKIFTTEELLNSVWDERTERDRVT